MNRERAQELLPIITAFAEGKTIEESAGRETRWYGAGGDIDFEWINYHWRIKPEPREWWMVDPTLYNPDERGYVNPGVQLNPSEYDYENDPEYIKVREVIE